MKTAFVIVLASAILAAAGPVKRSDLEVDWVFETVTVTVTGAPLQTSDSWKHLGHWSYPFSGSWTRPTGGWGPSFGGWSHDTPVPSTSASAIASSSEVLSVPTSSSVIIASMSSAAETSSSAAAANSVTSTSAAPSATVASAPGSFYPSSSAVSAPAATQALSDYAAPIIELHNKHRQNHTAPDIVWDDDLANIARDIANVCIYAHNVTAGGGGYGQNIGAGSPDSEVPSLINGMYNGEFNWYDGMWGTEPSMSNFEHWGHLSQMVWAATTKVGCYTKDCRSVGLGNVSPNVAGYFTVCNYKPAGNVAGLYGKNVQRPLGEPTYDV